LTFDFLKILRACGVETIVPPQRASGLPAMDYATVDVAMSAILANARAFAPAIDAGYTVVTTEPSAALALREEALAFCDDPLVGKLAANTVDAMSFLAGLLDQGKLPELGGQSGARFGGKDAGRGAGREEAGLETCATKRTVLGYHAPCHVKALGAAGATLRLMALIPGYELRAIEEGCCGIAGTWGMKRANYEKSMRLGAPLFEALRDPAIDLGLSECSTCRLQMEHGSAKAAVHPITLLARALDPF
jgi:Fe-S oxidoreductase